MPPKRKAAKKATPTPLRNPTRSSRTTKKLVDGDDDDSDAAEDDYSPIDQQSIASRRARYPRRRATERKIERFSPGEDNGSSSAPRQSPRSSRRKAARRAMSPQSSAGRGAIDPNRLLLEYMAAAKVAGIKAFLEKEASKPNTKKSKATVINQVLQEVLPNYPDADKNESQLAELAGELSLRSPVRNVLLAEAKRQQSKSAGSARDSAEPSLHKEKEKIPLSMQRISFQLLDWLNELHGEPSGDEGSIPLTLTAEEEATANHAWKYVENPSLDPEANKFWLFVQALKSAPADELATARSAAMGSRQSRGAGSDDDPARKRRALNPAAVDIVEDVMEWQPGEIRCRPSEQGSSSPRRPRRRGAPSAAFLGDKHQLQWAQPETVSVPPHGITHFSTEWEKRFQPGYVEKWLRDPRLAPPWVSHTEREAYRMELSKLAVTDGSGPRDFDIALALDAGGVAMYPSMEGTDEAEATLPQAVEQQCVRRWRRVPQKDRAIWSDAAVRQRLRRQAFASGLALQE